jgi:hypothetical protein
MSFCHFEIKTLAFQWNISSWCVHHNSKGLLLSKRLDNNRCAPTNSSTCLFEKPFDLELAIISRDLSRNGCTNKSSFGLNAKPGVFDTIPVLK